MSFIKKLSFNIDFHTFEVLRKSSATFLVKVIGMIAGLLISILLGRTLGAEGLGVISLSNQIISILLVLVMLGVNNVVVKEVSIAAAIGDKQKIATVIYTCFLINLPVAFGVTLLVAILAPYLSANVFHENDLVIPLVVSASVLLPQTLSRILSSGLNGLGKVWQSNLANEALSLAIAASTLLVFYFTGNEIKIVTVAIVYAFARVCVTATMIFYWRTVFRFSGQIKFNPKQILVVAIPLLAVSSTSLIAQNADTVMLGWLSNSREVGIYNVASRLAMLTSIFNIITASSISPKIALLFAKGKLGKIALMIRRITTGLTMIGLLSVVFFFLFGKQVLGLWGREFDSAIWILITLAIGQFFNIATGCTGVLLIMTGHHKELSLISIFSVILNLTLNYVLITSYGALGAAFATAITVITENIVKVIVVKNRLGISTILLLK